LFLRNHDELTLEMVTDEERDYMYSVYAAEPQMRLNVGIRRRLVPLVENSRRRVELLSALLFSMPGTPIIYYGDEIGMGDNIYLGDRNGVRTPMQWSSDRNGGFSRADPARLYAPPIMDPVYGYQALNGEAPQPMHIAQVGSRAAPAPDPVAATADSLPGLLVGVDWSGVLEGSTRVVLDRQALRPFLQRQRWFSSKAREIRNARFSDWTTIR